MDRPAGYAAHAIGSRDLALTQGPEHKEEIRFQGQVRVRNEGGTVRASDGGLRVTKANSVVLLITAAPASVVADTRAVMPPHIFGKAGSYLPKEIRSATDLVVNRTS